jgi:PhoH-like ATPase
MQEALLAPVNDIPLVIVKGPAGTAKTFYSLACGLQKVVEEKEYRKILVCRPTTTMDEDLGFLPGTENEKIAPYMRPIKDNLEVLVDSSANKRYENEKELSEKVQYLFEKEFITTEAVGFLRGRSIVKQWIIIDEAQNLTPKQAKAIITRAGEGTKIILVGDPEQIDNPFMDTRTNGLSYASSKMQGSPYCAQITLDGGECVRSKLSEDAAKRL